MSWTRRIFVREALKGWLGLVILPAIYAGTRGLTGSGGGPDLGQSRDVGAADALQPGMSKTVQLGSKRVLLARDRNGDVHAVSAMCTHMGCSIRFVPDQANGELACNCHASRFTLRGENLSGPATRPLTQYRIATVGGRLISSEMDRVPTKP